MRDPEYTSRLVMARPCALARAGRLYRRGLHGAAAARLDAQRDGEAVVGERVVGDRRLPVERDAERHVAQEVRVRLDLHLLADEPEWCLEGAAGAAEDWAADFEADCAAAASGLNARGEGAGGACWR